MENKYKVITFRGWEYARTYPEAIRIAYSRVKEIYKDFPSQPGIWWARIDYTFCTGKTRAYAIVNIDGSVSLKPIINGTNN